MIPKNGFRQKPFQEFRQKNENYIQCKKTQGNKTALKTENKQGPSKEIEQKSSEDVSKKNQNMTVGIFAGLELRSQVLHV